MLVWSIGLFLLAAAGGIVMAAQIFRGRLPPAALAVVHGAAAATALVLALLVAMRVEAAPAVKIGTGILVIAALGGFFLLSFHLRKLPHPKAVVVIHALAAVTGVVFLLAALAR